MPDRATGNSNTRRVLTLRTQTLLNWSSNKPEELVLIEPKLEILKQNLSLIHVWTLRFETQWNSMKLDLDKKWARLGTTYTTHTTPIFFLYQFNKSFISFEAIENYDIKFNVQCPKSKQSFPKTKFWQCWRSIINQTWNCGTTSKIIGTILQKMSFLNEKACIDWKHCKGSQERN